MLSGAVVDILDNNTNMERAVPQVSLVNEGAPPIELKRGTVLLGFGKVSWERVAKDETPPDDAKYVPVRFTSSNDVVIVPNALVDLHTALKEKRESAPTASICYHAPTLAPLCYVATTIGNERFQQKRACQP